MLCYQAPLLIYYKRLQLLQASLSMIAPKKLIGQELQLLGTQITNAISRVLAQSQISNTSSLQIEAISGSQQPQPITAEASVLRQNRCHILPIRLPLKALYVLCQPNKKLLLLDLDKTLIYYQKISGKIRVRPFLRLFLEKVSDLYNIYLFTAASETYVDWVLESLNELAGGVEFIVGFLAREHCIKVKQEGHKSMYVKDIRVVLHCQKSEIVVVDDKPISYCLNIQNAIPISPFKGQNFDRQLLYLIQILREAHGYQDVRQYIRKKYLSKS